MGLAQALEVAAFTVILGCAFGSVGWVITRTANRSDARTRQDALDALALSQAVRDITDVCARVDKLERRVTNHGEELAALGAIMDKHEEWHRRELHGPPRPGRPGH